MALSATDIILRSDKGAPLTIEEVDGNFATIRDFVNALEASIGVALNSDGTLKANSVDTEALQDEIIHPEHLGEDLLGDGLEQDGDGRIKVVDPILDFGDAIAAEEAARIAADGAEATVREANDTSEAELRAAADLVQAEVSGDIGSLDTTDKSSLVAAINEIFGMFSGVANLAALQQLVTPVGMMVDWAGAISAIPAGWGLCDGTDYGTVVAPDLTDHFIVHADADAAGTNNVGDEVGLNTAPGHTHPLPANTGGHALVEDETPEHTHELGLKLDGGASPLSGLPEHGTSSTIDTATTTPFGKSPADEHTHPIGGSSSSGGGHDNRPLAYAYAKIIFHGAL